MDISLSRHIKHSKFFFLWFIFLGVGGAGKSLPLWWQDFVTWFLSWFLNPIWKSNYPKENYSYKNMVLASENLASKEQNEHRGPTTDLLTLQKRPLLSPFGTIASLIGRGADLQPGLGLGINVWNKTIDRCSYESLCVLKSYEAEMKVCRAFAKNTFPSIHGDLRLVS